MVFVKLSVLVPMGNRCCSHHLFNKQLSYEALRMIDGSIADVMYLDSHGVAKLLNECFETINKTKSFDFDDPSALDNEAYYNMTGLGKGKYLLRI